MSSWVSTHVLPVAAILLQGSAVPHRDMISSQKADEGSSRSILSAGKNDASRFNRRRPPKFHAQFEVIRGLTEHEKFISDSKNRLNRSRNGKLFVTL